MWQLENSKQASVENRRDGVVSLQSWGIDVKVAFSPFITKAIACQIVKKPDGKEMKYHFSLKKNPNIL